MNESKRPNNLRLCKLCGCKGGGLCGRMIGSDDSVWPIRDTGYRHTGAKQ